MKSKFIIQYVLILLGTLFLVTGFSISSAGFAGDIMNQRSYVIILASLLISFSVISIFAELVKSKSKRKNISALDEQMKSAEFTEEPKEKTSYKVYLAMLLVLLFAYGFTYIGFYVTSFLFVFIITWLLFNWEKNKLVRSIIFSFFLNLSLFVLFSLVNVYFPKAWLF